MTIQKRARGAADRIDHRPLLEWADDVHALRNEISYYIARVPVRRYQAPNVSRRELYAAGAFYHHRRGRRRRSSW